MKILTSYFEIPWLIAVISSYFAAKYNNAYEKHLEIYAPLVVCLIALVISTYFFKGHKLRLESYLPYVRFFGVGFICTIAVYLIWGEFGTAYLKETALGVAVFYMIFGLLNVIGIAAMTAYMWIKR